MDENEENNAPKVFEKPKEFGSDPLDFEEGEDDSEGPTVRVAGIK